MHLDCSLCSFVATSRIARVGNVLFVLPYLILLFVGVRELEPPYVVFVEPIALKSVYDNRGLKCVLKVGEAKDHFFIWGFLSRDQTHRFESPERSENV